MALVLSSNRLGAATQVKSVMTDAKLIYRVTRANAKAKSSGLFYVSVSNKSDMTATGFAFKSITGGYRYGIHKDGDPFPSLVKSIKLDWSPEGAIVVKPWTTVRFVVRSSTSSGWLPPKKGYVRCIDLFAAYKTKNTLHDSTWMLTAPD